MSMNSELKLEFGQRLDVRVIVDNDDNKRMVNIY